MKQRLELQKGEWIVRTQPLHFTFEGKQYQGYAGDTVSSALWAAGVRVLGRSFKYHRQRGIYSLANHDTNALMQSPDALNIRADITPLQEGMKLWAVNTRGGVLRDINRHMGKLTRFLPVGFYYKAFHTKALFPFWEKIIRNFSGLGTLDLRKPVQPTPKRYDFCDVLVVGAGLSGLSAALAAAQQGAQVVLVDENAALDGLSDSAVLALIQQVREHSNIRCYTATYAAAYYADYWVPLVDANKITKMRARSVVIAQGVYEQPAVFHNNDLPGVMAAGAALRLLRRYRVQPMQRLVALVANPEGYAATLALHEAGVEVAAIVDLRTQPSDCQAQQAVQAAGLRILQGYCIYEAFAGGGEGGLCVASVHIAPWDGKGKADVTRLEWIACDGVLMSTGFAPAANLLYQAGAVMGWSDAVQQFVPETLPAGVFACGRVNGVYDIRSRLGDGGRAGSEAAAFAGYGVGVKAQLPPVSYCPSHPWPIVEHPKGKNFVDFDEDLQYKDFVNAVQEGYDNIELLKRYSTNGMGPSQGKHSNMNGLRILARLTGQKPQEVGTTTARPFFHPTPISHLAGRGFTPERHTPMRAMHTSQGAVWMPAGVWERPAYYTVAGKSRQACIQEEVRNVRTNVGMIDVGTLGKLEVIGPDAATFLERVYISKYARLKVNKTRYAVMCDETGVVMDDGVVARLSEQHFYFTTTTSGAATIYRELVRLNTEWGLNCGVINHTGAFAALNLAGPRSRRVLAKLCDADLSAAAFPYLGLLQARVAGIPARLMRVGFVGEWGYEIHVTAQYGPALWKAVAEAGAEFGIRPFGVEAQRALRLEKGHIIIGQDTDGLTVPRDAGLTWATKMDKPFFVGKRSLQAIDKLVQKQLLVGFTIEGGEETAVPLESHLVIVHGEIAGRVTSIGYSASLGKHIGLAYASLDLTRPGSILPIRLGDGSMVRATVVETPFYDPKGARQTEEALL